MPKAKTIKSKASKPKAKKIKKSYPVPKAERVGAYWEALNNVIDPELGIGIVDLGLVYDVEVVGKHVTVTLTLTSMGCPVGPSIMRMVQMEMEQYMGSEEVTVKLVWKPVWSKELIDPDIRAMMMA
ncbi:MAG: metal-sulfur cluster assembly factor [bacterium]|nr:metal-sulfur cluster assembly factor [bacterium]